jgi:hypothetical protein
MIQGVGELIRMERGTGKTSQMVAEALAEQEALNEAGDTKHNIIISVMSEMERGRVTRLLNQSSIPKLNTRVVVHKLLPESLYGKSGVSVYIDEFTGLPARCYEALDAGVCAGRIGVMGWYS